MQGLIFFLLFCSELRKDLIYQMYGTLFRELHLGMTKFSWSVLFSEFFVIYLVLEVVCKLCKQQTPWSFWIFLFIFPLPWWPITHLAWTLHPHKCWNFPTDKYIQMLRFCWWYYLFIELVFDFQFREAYNAYCLCASSSIMYHQVFWAANPSSLISLILFLC